MYKKLSFNISNEWSREKIQENLKGPSQGFLKINPFKFLINRQLGLKQS
jgi:hypothetical protein